MKRRQWWLALGLTLATTSAFAHPPRLVEARAQVMFDKTGAFDGIRNTWVFDEEYSAFAVMGLEKNGKLASPQDLARRSPRQTSPRSPNSTTSPSPSPAARS